MVGHQQPAASQPSTVQPPSNPVPSNARLTPGLTLFVACRTRPVGHASRTLSDKRCRTLLPQLLPQFACENFLYGFKAARRAARAAASAPWPSLCWRSAPAGPAPVGWREKTKRGPLDIQQVSHVQAGRPCSRCRDCPGPVRTRQGRL